MDTTYLEDQIKSKEQEITDKQKQIDLIRTGIEMDKSILKILKKGLDKIKGNNAHS